MDITQAISHCEDVVNKSECPECAAQHLQLKEWLQELESRRKQTQEYSRKFELWRYRLLELLMEINYSYTHREKRDLCEQTYRFITRELPQLSTYWENDDIPF